MFSDVSNFSNDVDFTFALIIGISLFFLIGLTALMIYFIYRYHHTRNPKATDIEGSVSLEIAWTVIPTLLVLVMFYYGWSGYTKMRTPPDDAMVIKATGRMWSWSFEYENGRITDTLVIPKDKAVKLDLISEDVIHSLYIPAFRIKEDMVPGTTNWMWFIGQQEGSYSILCAEYCGDRHSYMISKVDVIPQDDFKTWYNTKTVSNDHPGLVTLKTNACIACHSLDGTRLVGPSFKGLIGRKTEIILEDGSEISLTADSAYIIESLNEPNVKIVKSYSKGLMQSYKDKFTKEQQSEIIEYLETIK